jgi:D-methionine transport system substrate-binding protein
MKLCNLKFWALCLGILTIVFPFHLTWALKVGVTAGPHASIMGQVKKELAKSGVSLEIKEFNDFILPNEALNQGDLDLNCYQHQFFLDQQVQARGYQLVSIAKTIVLPLGIYSEKYQDLKSVPAGSRISIPNDPTNEGRALLLLQKAGLITLKTAANPTVLDISQNSKNLRFIEIEAPQLPRTLADVALAVINTDWVLVAGLDPKKALFSEGSDSLYVNLIVVKKGNEKREDIQKFVKAYQSKPIKDYILKQYHGAILPAW